MPDCLATHAAIRQWSTMFRQPSSSNQSTLPGLAPTVMKLSVSRLNLQVRRSSTHGWNHSGRHGSGGAAAGTARNALQIPGIVRQSKSGVFRGGSHPELIEIRLAHRHRTPIQKLLHSRGGVGRDKILEQF